MFKLKTSSIWRIVVSDMLTFNESPHFKGDNIIKTVIPESENDTYDCIFLPPMKNQEEYRIKYTRMLETYANPENAAINIINMVSNVDISVNNIIQKEDFKL